MSMPFIPTSASASDPLPAPATPHHTGAAWWFARVGVLEHQRQVLHRERDAARGEAAVWKARVRALEAATSTVGPDGED